MSILTRLWGLVGGPDFRSAIDYHFNLEGKFLSFRVPVTHIDLEKDMPVDININDKQFVGKYITSFGPAVFIPINKWRWNYSSRLLCNNAAASASLSVRVRKVESKRPIPNEQAMKEYLTWEYDDYYEDEENQGAKGYNRYQRERILDFFQRKYGYGHEKIDFSQEMNEHLDGLLNTVPQESDFHKYKGVDNDWVYFFLKKEMNFPASHYCFRLDDYNILEFVFTYMSDEYAIKEKILDVRHELEKRIMDTVSITSGAMLTN